VKAGRREGDDQANGAIGIGLGASAVGAERTERHEKEDGNNGPGSTRLNHLTNPRCRASPDTSSGCRHQSFFISPTIASPISVVVTTLVFSDLISAVRSPCASAAAMAASIWSASLAILSEYRSAMPKEASMAMGLATP